MIHISYWRDLFWRTLDGHWKALGNNWKQFVEAGCKTIVWNELEGGGRVAGSHWEVGGQPLQTTWFHIWYVWSEAGHWMSIGGQLEGNPGGISIELTWAGYLESTGKRAENTSQGGNQGAVTTQVN
jgi:hypothetical protein